MGRISGARDLTVDVLKEWFYYFYQCTECRRCSVFCPYGIDTAEITMMGRELLNLLASASIGSTRRWRIATGQATPGHSAARIQRQHRIRRG